MQFSFVLTNHRPAALQALDDVLRPLFAGLRATGHRVVTPVPQFQKRPVVNVVVEDFSDPAFTGLIQGTRSAWGDDFILGVLCAFGSDGPETPPARRDGLRAMLPLADFAWTLAPDQLPPGLLPPDRTALLGSGYHQSLAGPRLIADATARDIDVVVYGPEHDRLAALVRSLDVAKLGSFVLRPGVLPDYLVTDLLSRGKTVAVIGDGRTSPGLLRPRIVKAICNGALVLAEPGSADEGLAGTFAECPLNDMPAQCHTIVASGHAARRGLQALERLKLASMQDALAAALAVSPLAMGRG
jgi:hypothetical protein